MPVDDRTRAQARLILNGHPDAAAHPAPDRWDDVDDFDYLYREYAILVRAQDAEEVAGALRRILDQASATETSRRVRRGRSSASTVSRGLVRLTVPTTPTLVPDLIGRLDDGSRALGWPGPSIRFTSARIPVPPPSRSRCRRHRGARPAARLGRGRPPP